MINSTYKVFSTLQIAMNGSNLKNKIPARLLQVEQLQRTFFEAVNKNDAVAVRDFIQKRITTNCVAVDARNEIGETPLIVSARLGHTQIVELLIQSGADVDAKDLELWNPLLNAAKNGFGDVVQILLQNDADLEQCDVGGWTPLFWAVYKNRVAVVKLLLEARAEVHVTDEYGMIPLLWASGRGYFEILTLLVLAGAKLETRDRFGNNALFWSCKKGCSDGALLLINSGCPIDVVGVHGMTPLIIAVKGRHTEIVRCLLQKNANVNTLDQDGLTALAYACQSGDAQITDLLLSYGAYVNILDRKKESFLMKAVKSGQIDVVKALLTKYADLDVQDEDGRTALHLSIDKGFIDILALLVGHKPNTEIRNKDGDTPLLKAVKCRNVMAVQLLVHVGSKVAACDKRGDTSLHIALRSRSRRLTQILLSRPQDSQLLYQPNKARETPYSIDQSRGQPILPHIFGPAESQVQTEAMLGYDVYSNVLADIICEPLLSLPLSVGLYAKWGSGKSFLLNKLRASLLVFSRSWMEAKDMAWSWLAVFCNFVACSIVSIAVFGFVPPLWSLGLFFLLIFASMLLYSCVVYSQRRHFRIIRRYLNPHFVNCQMLAQILFYHPPNLLERDRISRPVGFIFADYHRLSSIGGVQALANIVEKLYVELENLYGSLAVRLCSAFSATYSNKQESELRRFCGVPVLAMAASVFIFAVAALFLCACYLQDRAHSHGFIISGVSLLVICVVLGAYPLTVTLWYASHLTARRHIRRALSKLDSLRIEGFMQKLSCQVQLLENTVRRLDSYSSSQTRMVVFVDGLDSCEQERMLQTFDAIQLLFCSKPNSSFILFIAVDPHIVVSAVQRNMGTVFTRTDLNGYDYLKNLIQMPFYLHNTAIQRMHERISQIRRESFDYLRWKAMKSDNVYGSLLSLAESKGGSTRLRPGVSQNLHEQTFGERIINDDYFTNINPRSIRRVINSITVSGRLMRAFDVSFNWVALGHWISLVEQWPYRLSWMTDYCEHNSPTDSTTLKEIYDAVKTRIPNAKSEDELVEIDRNTRNLELYLENSKDPVLTAGHLRSFLPFTSNLDPYLRKLIHDKFCGQNNVDTPMEIGQSASTSRDMLDETNQIEIFRDPVFYVALRRLLVSDVCSLLKKLPLSSATTTDEYCSAFKSANISGLVLAHCDLQDLRSQFHFTFGDWTLISLMILHLRKIEPQILLEEAKYKPPVKMAGIRRSRSRTISCGRRKSVIYEHEVPSDMAEVSATTDFLQHRLAHLDSVEFAGDLPSNQGDNPLSCQATPDTRHAAFLARVDKPDEELSDISYGDSSEYARNFDFVTDTSTARPALDAAAVALSMSPRPSSAKSKVQRLVEAIGGTIEETNRLLLTRTSSDDEDRGPRRSASSDDSAGEEVAGRRLQEQETVRERKANATVRPSVFALSNGPHADGTNMRLNP